MHHQPSLRRLGVAMGAAAIGGFGMLHGTQALLPAIGRAYDVGPTAASLSLSAATGALALAVLPLSVLADARGRVLVMRAGLVLGVLATLAAAAAPTYAWHLVARAVAGAAIAGLMAVAVAHIGDEVPPQRLGAAVGAYVAGNTVGGIAGRVVPGAVTGVVEGPDAWRWGLAALAVTGLVTTVVFWVVLPPPTTAPSGGGARQAWRETRVVMADRGVQRIALAALLAMGAFTATYNFMTFRLEGAPFSLPTSLVSLLFLAYLAGTVVSPLAGRLSDRWGRRRVALAGALVAAVGELVSLPSSLPLAALGLVLVTSGFFALHSVASAWASERGEPRRATAAALYVMAYYVGASGLGAAVGPVFDAAGWTGAVVALVLLLAGAAAAILGVADVVPTRAAAPGSER